MDDSSPVTNFKTENAAGRIDAVLFDYGQVLSCPPDPAAWARMQSVTGLDEDRLHQSYWAFRSDYDRGSLTGPAYWNAVAQHAGIVLDDSQRTALLAADVDLWTRLNLRMVEWAGRLQQAGVRTAILSNIGDSIAEGIVARLPWLDGFEHCIWSHALSLAKPDPAIYQKAEDTLKLAPANLLFIDDRAENVAGAAAVGMQALHYTSHAEFEQEMRARGFASLLEVGLTPTGADDRAGHASHVK